MSVSYDAMSSSSLVQLIATNIEARAEAEAMMSLAVLLLLSVDY